jgi:hypothetical protein
MKQNIISDRNLEATGYKYKGNYAGLQIHGEGIHVLLLEPVRGMGGYYSVYGSYLNNKEGSFKNNYLHQGVQLDLFETTFDDGLEKLINTYAW